MDENKYYVHDSNVAWLNEKIEKLNKRAKRLGVEPLQVVYVDKEVEILDDGTANVTHIVEIQGTAPTLNGWTLVATIDHTHTENIVRIVPDKEIPAKYRHADSDCDHCNIRRSRNETVILQHTDGTYKQVGKTCVKDFLDGHSVNGIMFWATMMEDIEEYLKECATRGSGGKHYFSLERFLSFVSICIREDGWVSRQKANEWNRQSTTDNAINHMFPSVHMKMYHSDEIYKPTDEDVEIAKQAIEWAKTIDIQDDGLTDYMYNLGVLAREEAITMKDAGIVASMISAYQRATQERVEREKAKVSKHFGVVGKRDTFNLTLTNVYMVDSFYGTKAIHRFMDENGNIAIWNTSPTQLEKGQTYQVKATVKEHGDYKGTLQTILTRCAVK